MLRALYKVFIISLSLLIVGCELFESPDSNKDPELFERRDLPRELSENEKSIVDGTGEFGFNLMKKLLEEKPAENHFVSPLSIMMAWGMTMNGAEGETRSQIENLFGLGGMDRNEINQAVRELIDLLSEFDDQVQFEIANSIWHRDSFQVENDFLETNQAFYQATVEAADFDDPATVDRINQWVSENTNALIEEIVDGPIDPLTVMYLINAIYFNGDWTVQFDPDNTEKKPFHRPDGSSTETEMMRMEEEEGMLYKRGDDYQAVNLYYGDAGFAMTLVLPDEEVGLETWIENQDWGSWTDKTETFNEVTLTLELPKFELEYEIDDFPEILKAMGVVDPFDAALSDFSRINPDYEDLHVSDTRHKTFIRVDEEGTEAAAVTSVEVGLTSLPSTVEVRFDRPFFYVIREVESNSILFMGTQTDPSL